MRVAPQVRDTLSHCDHWELRLIKFLIILLIIIIIIIIIIIRILIILMPIILTWVFCSR